MENKLLTAGVIVALVIGGFALLSGGNDGRDGRDGSDGVGGIPGGDVHTHLSAHNGITAGGRIATTTTASTYTTVANDFKKTQTYWDVLPNVITTITIDATSTHPYIPQVGDVSTVYIKNASSTVAAEITLAAGEGVDIQYTEATGGDLVLAGLNWAKLTFIRESIYEVAIIYSEFTPGD